MICDACGIDKTITVLFGITLVRINSRTGRETPERRERRLCAPCGGALSDEEMIP